MKPGLKRLIAGILLMVLAFFIPFAAIMGTIILMDSAPEERFEIPGSVEFQADKSGRYYLWHHYETVYEGTTFNDPTGVPDSLKIEVIDGDGELMEFIADGTMTSGSTSGTKRSVGYVELERPDKLTFSVSGECAPTVFSVSQSHLFKAVGSFFFGFALAALCGLLGFALLVWGIIRLCIGQKADPPPMPA